MATREALDQLHARHLSQCDSKREHRYGVAVGMLDNPGWRLRVDAAGTMLATARSFAAKTSAATISGSGAGSKKDRFKPRVVR
jgi:hypothetical protein